MDALGREILQIAFPAALALAADPVASLIDTAFIGRIGAVELAAVGVAIAVFNQASRITIYPLVSITTSFVAEEDTIEKMNVSAETNKCEVMSHELIPDKKANTDSLLENLEKGMLKDAKSDHVTGSKSRKQDITKKERRHIASASTAMLFGTVLGVLQTIVLILAAQPLLSIMGVKSSSPMLVPALRYLRLRSLGAPAVLLSLALQGIFRGFKDTKTPLYATVAGDTANVILDPILIFACRLGVTGAAIAHVFSQYLIFAILLWRLTNEVDLMPPSFKELQYRRFLSNGILLMTRVIAVTFCVTLAASLAARQGPIPMAAFQICLQVWLTSSLLADGLAVAGQAILACAFAEKDFTKAKAAATRVLQMSVVLGLGLTVVVGAGLHFGKIVFTSDANVLKFISLGIPFVAGTQCLNSLAFVFDGVNYGACDFKYAAYSMVVVAAGSMTCLFLLSKSYGFVGLWIALTIYMALRTFAGVWRMGTGTGPWRFLRGRSSCASQTLTL
ncbi:hypothetical protein QQ045_003307 [Rhodiola kirilowii]